MGFSWTDLPPTRYVGQLRRYLYTRTWTLTLSATNWGGHTQAPCRSTTQAQLRSAVTLPSQQRLHVRGPPPPHPGERRWRTVTRYRSEATKDGLWPGLGLPAPSRERGRGRVQAPRLVAAPLPYCAGYGDYISIMRTYPVSILSVPHSSHS